MEQWIMEVMDKFGYFGVFLLITLENIFPPIPSEVILTFGGFMTYTTSMTITGVVIASTLGSVLGAILLYGVGRFLDVERLEKIIDKYGKILRVTKEDVHKAEGFFQKHGVATIFFCRFIPLIRSLISIPAGMAKMNLWTFTLFTTLGTFIWNVVLVNVGAAVGENWDSIVGYMDIYSNIVYAILGLLFITVVIWFIKTRVLKTKKEEKKEQE